MDVRTDRLEAIGRAAVTSATGVPVPDGGLLMAGVIIPVPGVTVIGPHDTAWSHLDAGDGKPRKNRPQQVILHKTKADDPERIAPGRGPEGRAHRVSSFWQGDPQHSGAQLVIDGWVAACLADLIYFEAYHGNQANELSIGIEHYEEADATTYQGTYENAVPVWRTIAETVGIQLQFPKLGTYHGGPLRRFADGGRTLVGFFGHRDVTDHRGRWDPGDHVFELLERVLGAEGFDFADGEDLAVWKQRQIDLNARGHKLVVDGVPGPATTAALKLEGFRGGVFALGKV